MRKTFCDICNAEITLQRHMRSNIWLFIKDKNPISFNCSDGGTHDKDACEECMSKIYWHVTEGYVGHEVTKEIGKELALHDGVPCSSFEGVGNINE